MIKLADILKEISLEEKIVKVPQEVIAKGKEAFNYIDSNLEKLKSKAGDNYDAPYVDPKFKDYFKLKDLKGNDLSVSLGMYNDPKDAGAARMDTRGTEDILLVNLAFLRDYDDFEDTIEHELVHAMDPKVRDMHIHAKISDKGTEPSSDDATMTKYAKSPWEFDAFTAPLINKLSKNLKNTGTNRKAYQQLLISIFSDIRTKGADTVLQDDKYAPLAWMFTKKEWKEENWDAAWTEFAAEIDKIRRWATKPTLYKQFLKRLGTEL